MFIGHQTPMSTTIHEILLRHRATPLRNGSPRSNEIIKTKMYNKSDNAIKRGKSSLSSVLHSQQILWKIGVVAMRLGNLHYIIKLNNGFVFKRQISQLRASTTQIPKTVESSPSDSA